MKFKIITTSIALFLIGISSIYYIKTTNAIHIAFVVGLSGENSSHGQSLVDGANLYINEVNKQGGINGHKIVLDVFDDQNDATIAKQKALEIVEQNQAVGIIGHRFSNSSLSGGEIYKKHRIPAITPFSTTMKVTQDNEWYFRTIFDDNLQGRFLANYIKHVFQPKQVSIIGSDDIYGTYLSQIFLQTANDLGMEVKHQWTFKKDDTADQERNLYNIAKQLKEKSAEAGVVFLATHVKEGVKLVKFIKDLNIKNIMVAPDALALNDFPQSFKDYPKEQKKPGYYTDGLYVATPLIFDSAGGQALYFQEKYQTLYKKKMADWHTVFSYDAAMMLIDAIKKTGISGDDLSADRQKLQQYLANDLKNIDNAIEGLAGFNYFDNYGNAQKPIFMGVYKNNTIVSATSQFKDIPNINDITNLKTLRANKQVLLINNKYMYKTNVVYTGIKINKISDIDLSDLTYTLDFYLWFRFKDNIDPQNLDFLNTVEPVELQLVDEIDDELKYHLYHAKGVFKADFMPKYNSFRQHTFGVSFRHKKLPHNNLIYVRDALGMGGFLKNSQVKKLQTAQVLSPKYDGIIDFVLSFQDITFKDSLGNPKHLKAQDATVEYSRFNMLVMVKDNELSLLAFIPQSSAKIICLLGIFFMILLFVLSRQYSCHFTTIYILQIILTFLFLISGEVMLISKLIGPHIPTSYLEAATMGFDALWWIVTAIFVHIAADHYLWQKLEKKTGRPIPRLAYNMWIFIIYSLASFGIIGFVFERPITSLLATSGVMAIIIGLAIQMNLSNIFSGLAIHIERPFQVNDWVKIGSYDEGIIEDINWRATKLCTRTGCSLTIPNSTVASADIFNFSEKETFWLWPRIYIDPRHPPQQVRKIIDEALLSVNEIMKEPAPMSIFKEVNEWAAVYWVCICLNDYNNKNLILQTVWETMWNTLDQAGIKPAVRRQEIYTFDGDKERKFIPLVD
ncbi:ABC transporter substrate-binding protein [Candidatus Halobeggiatoa sp. HSG11]|nr:ABC transporter substrate-binding protein [Candidatus Halobeggiatoa sp. HSG11]